MLGKVKLDDEGEKGDTVQNSIDTPDDSNVIPFDFVTAAKARAMRELPEVDEDEGLEEWTADTATRRRP